MYNSGDYFEWRGNIYLALFTLFVKETSWCNSLRLTVTVWLSMHFENLNSSLT